MTALPSAEAKLTFPRGSEQQSPLVEAPAAEHPPYFHTIDGTERIFGIDADFVLSLAHRDRLAGGQVSAVRTGSLISIR